ncbi:hypothetical protein HGRIS_010562 [Hohenbuehelia grisea]|uniref:NAD(P)-binding protein n=1 Tax=Hohenbuehelia grisea TaxID=104357 RepID=A0ABR3IXB0_9AGAR
MSSYTEKVAIVTGAAQGMGRSIATQLAEDGYSIVAIDLASKQNLLDEVVEEIKTGGKKALAFAADVSSEKDVAALVGKTTETFGGVDVMVANAGVCWPRSLLEVTVDEWERLFAVNVRGVLLCYQYAAKAMIAQGRGGSIIGASSIAGKKGLPMTSAYCASKAAIRSLTQTAAQELGGFNIRVNAYAPGAIVTPMLVEAANLMPNGPGSGEAAVVEQYTKTTALHRVGQPTEIAGLVSFLASDKSSYITGKSYTYVLSHEANYIPGQTITADGGVWFD